MDLTPIQRRTLEQLIAPGQGTLFDAGLEARLRARIERAVAHFGRDSPLRLSKERLNDLARCEGLFQAVTGGEGHPFRHSPKTAAGALLHKAVELEAGGREPVDPRTLAERSAARLAEDRAFGPYWDSLGGPAQDEVLSETVRGIELFRGSFPPLRGLARVLQPVSEMWVAAEFCGGAVAVWGRVDLTLRALEPGKATRILIDFKTGRAWPDYPEDMRLYALLHTLRFGVPPLRVATLFMESGEWQAEDVAEETLVHAADRLIAAVRAASEIDQSREAVLTPGPYCGWCPRSSTCPSSAALRPASQTAPGHG